MMVSIHAMQRRPMSSRSSRSSREPKRHAGSPGTGRPVRQAALAEVKDDRFDDRREDLPS
jgi:hypothetical protein